MRRQELLALFKLTITSRCPPLARLLNVDNVPLFTSRAIEILFEYRAFRVFAKRDRLQRNDRDSGTMNTYIGRVTTEGLVKL